MMRLRPQQPDEHEAKCPCYECEKWAHDLLDWEEEEVNAGRNPWQAGQDLFAQYRR